MKILPYIGAIVTTGALLIGGETAKAQTVKTDTLKYDTYTSITQKVTPAGTDDEAVLLSAPDPSVTIAGEEKTAAIIVDLSRNILYHYNENGIADAAYLVASGKKNTPTDPGVRIIKNIETYPYKYAPPSTKRRRQPWNYGPKTLILEKLDPKTGERSKTGEFIHGNNKPSSLGKYESLGCVRMDNEVIKKLAAQVKRGDIVIMMKNGSYDE